MGNVPNGKLVVTPDVDRIAVVAVHERSEAPHAVCGKLETARSAAVTVYGDGLLPIYGGTDEIGHRTPIADVHPRAISIEDAGYADVEVVLGSVGVGESLGDPLTFVVA